MTFDPRYCTAVQLRSTVPYIVGITHTVHTAAKMTAAITLVLGYCAVLPSACIHMHYDSRVVQSTACSVPENGYVPMGVYPGYVPMGAYPGYSYHSRRKISFAFYSGVILSHVSHP